MSVLQSLIVEPKLSTSQLRFVNEGLLCCILLRTILKFGTAAGENTSR